MAQPSTAVRPRSILAQVNRNQPWCWSTGLVRRRTAAEAAVVAVAGERFAQAVDAVEDGIGPHVDEVGGEAGAQPVESLPLVRQPARRP